MSSSTTSATHMPRLPVLDGWRGISILFVLMAHMLPLGHLNGEFAAAGMALFFTLSGFLITSTLYFYPSVYKFAIRRFFRIVPLAWLYTAITLGILHAGPQIWFAQFLFYSNLPPFWLTSLTGHLWSLCVEVQFYCGIGLLFFLLRKRGLALLPFFCLAVTLGRVWRGHTIDIITIYRVDEILAGATLAYLFHSRHRIHLENALCRINPFFMLILLFLAGHDSFTWLNYARPYCAASLVGITLVHSNARWSRVLESKSLAYIATISYALYIWHPLTIHGWFDVPDKVLKYERRTIAIALSFLAAHISTFYFEKFWINVGKRLTSDPKRVPVDQEAMPTES